MENPNAGASAGLEGQPRPQPDNFVDIHDRFNFFSGLVETPALPIFCLA